MSAARTSARGALLASVACAAIAAAPALAGDLPLEVSAAIEGLDGGTLGVGVPFRLIVEARHAPGQVALLPETLPFEPSKLAERRGARRHTRADRDGAEVDRYELELLAFEAGSIQIPAIPLAVGSTRAETRPIDLEVATGFSESELPVATSTIPEAMAELERMAAQDPSPVPVWVEDRRPLYGAAAAAVALLVGWAVLRALRARRRAQAAVEPPAPPPRPAHEVALERLARLRAAGHLERGELKAFFSELSEILREYSGARYGFESLDLTVDELMLQLARTPTPGLDLIKLRWVLERADLVKFAKLEVDVTEAATALSEADDIIARTQPREVPTVGVEASTDAERRRAS